MSGFVSKVAETYAEALLAFAKSRDALKETTIEMNLISRLLKVSVELQKFLSNPLNGREVKKNIVKDVLGDQIDPNTMKFLFTSYPKEYNFRVVPEPDVFFSAHSIRCPAKNYGKFTVFH